MYECIDGLNYTFNVCKNVLHLFRQETELVRLSVAHILQTKTSMWYLARLTTPSGLEI